MGNTQTRSTLIDSSDRSECNPSVQKEVDPHHHHHHQQQQHLPQPEGSQQDNIQPQLTEDNDSSHSINQSPSTEEVLLSHLLASSSASALSSSSGSASSSSSMAASETPSSTTYTQPLWHDSNESAINVSTKRKHATNGQANTSSTMTTGCLPWSPSSMFRTKSSSLQVIDTSTSTHQDDTQTSHYNRLTLLMVHQLLKVPHSISWIRSKSHWTKTTVMMKMMMTMVLHAALDGCLHFHQPRPLPPLLHQHRNLCQS
jgi:hypothetical protein